MINGQQYDNEPEPPSVDPIPFNVEEHGSQYRRSHRDNCREQYILFVLDASGSIGKQRFDRVTELLAELVLYFCKPIRAAAMTFDHRFFSELCFNDYDNTGLGRLQTSSAMRSIDYNGRGGATYTAGAARCACNYMLTPACGISVSAACTDVIFLTDGRANDPSLDICTEIQCLHNRSGVDTSAIGVGDYDTLRLGCYGENDLGLDEYYLFNFPNFTELEQQFQLVLQRLLNGALYGGDYTCASTGVDPQG